MSTSASQPVSARPSRIRIRDARRIAIIATIGSLSFAALVGIVVLLTGAFGITEGRILLTTLTAAGFTTAALCHLALTGPKAPTLWITGIGMSVLALLAGVILIWTDSPSYASTEWLIRTFGVLTVLSVCLAHMSLLLAIGGRRGQSRGLMVARVATHAAIIALAILLCLPIIDAQFLENSPDYWRLVGMVAIIDLLGSILVPILVRLTRDPALDQTQPLSTPLP